MLLRRRPSCPRCRVWNPYLHQYSSAAWTFIWAVGCKIFFSLTAKACWCSFPGCSKTSSKRYQPLAIHAELVQFC